MLIVTIVLHHNLGINSLSLIHHILGKLNFFPFGPLSFNKSSMWPSAEKLWRPLL